MSWTTTGRIVALVVLVSGPLAAQQGSEETGPGPQKPVLEDMEPLPRLETALANIRAQVRNASMRVKYVTQGRPQVGNMIPAHERVVRNSARDCCTRNIEIISDRLETVVGAVRELYASHQQNRNEKALELVHHMGDHVSGLSQKFDSFTKASESPAALKSLDGMGDELLHLDRDLAQYHECCADGGNGRPGG